MSKDFSLELLEKRSQKPSCLRTKVAMLLWAIVQEFHWVFIYFHVWIFFFFSFCELYTTLKKICKWIHMKDNYDQRKTFDIESTIMLRNLFIYKSHCKRPRKKLVSAAHRDMKEHSNIYMILMQNGNNFGFDYVDFLSGVILSLLSVLAHTPTMLA